MLRLGTSCLLLCNLKHLQILEGDMPDQHHTEVCLLDMNTCGHTNKLFTDCCLELGIANDDIILTHGRMVIQPLRFPSKSSL